MLAFKDHKLKSENNPIRFSTKYTIKGKNVVNIYCGFALNDDEI